MPVLVGLPSIGTITGLPAKRLKGALGTRLDTSEQEGMGPYLCECSLYQAHGCPPRGCMPWLRLRCPGKENLFPVHAGLQNGPAQDPSDTKRKLRAALPPG